MTWIVAGFAIINAILLPMLVIVIFPRWLRAQGTLKLQALRDDLWDGVADGRIETTVATQTLAELIERTVVQLRMFSLARIVTLRLAMRLSMPDLYSIAQYVARTKVDEINAPGAQAAVIQARRRYLEIVFRHTTVGWMLLAKKDAQFSLLTIMEAASNPEARSVTARVLQATFAR